MNLKREIFLSVKCKYKMTTFSKTAPAVLVNPSFPLWMNKHNSAFSNIVWNISQNGLFCYQT
jgi:hypothetical protein